MLHVLYLPVSKVIIKILHHLFQVDECCLMTNIALLTYLHEHENLRQPIQDFE